MRFQAIGRVESEVTGHLCGGGQVYWPLVGWETEVMGPLVGWRARLPTILGCRVKLQAIGWVESEVTSLWWRGE